MSTEQHQEYRAKAHKWQSIARIIGWSAFGLWVLSRIFFGKGS